MQKFCAFVCTHIFLGLWPKKKKNLQWRWYRNISVDKRVCPLRSMGHGLCRQTQLFPARVSGRNAGKALNLSLSFFIYKMEITMIPTLWDCWQDCESPHEPRRALDTCEHPWDTLVIFPVTCVFTKQGGRCWGEKGYIHMNQTEEGMKSHKVRDGSDAPQPQC